ncbi:MAG: hypothetical protein F2546_02700 [Actinobacteria bacterium]|nr:hypothetical protein [Actinomycetota bacterium]
MESRKISRDGIDRSRTANRGHGKSTAVASVAPIWINKETQRIAVTSQNTIPNTRITRFLIRIFDFGQRSATTNGSQRAN